jgi:hypothetical protein
VPALFLKISADPLSFTVLLIQEIHGAVREDMPGGGEKRSFGWSLAI